MRHRLALSIKRAVYGHRGEPYRICGKTLRYVVGSRPIRLKYQNSTNDVVRYDTLQMKMLSRSIKEGDFAIDIGAHGGQVSMVMAAAAGRTGHVIAFEPDPAARAMLEANVMLNRDVKAPTVEAFGVSDITGPAVLYSRGGDANSSLALSAISGQRDPYSVPIHLVTLDGYLAERALPAPAWLKIDTEGAEIRILRGATSVLRAPTRILCELHPYAWPELGTTFEELQGLASAHGRRLRYLDETTEATREKYGIVALERAL